MRHDASASRGFDDRGFGLLGGGRHPGGSENVPAFPRTRADGGDLRGLGNGEHRAGGASGAGGNRARPGGAAAGEFPGGGDQDGHAFFRSARGGGGRDFAEIPPHPAGGGSSDDRVDRRAIAGGGRDGGLSRVAAAAGAGDHAEPAGGRGAAGRAHPRRGRAGTGGPAACGNVRHGGAAEGRASRRAKSAWICFSDAGEVHHFRAARIPVAGSHGTGCTLSAAVAAGLARGEALANAVEVAEKLPLRNLAEVLWFPIRRIGKSSTRSIRAPFSRKTRRDIKIQIRNFPEASACIQALWKIPFTLSVTSFSTRPSKRTRLIKRVSPSFPAGDSCCWPPPFRAAPPRIRSSRRPPPPAAAAPVKTNANTAYRTPAVQGPVPRNPDMALESNFSKNSGITFSRVLVSGNYVAITFDDGPHPQNTPRLLDMLRARNIKATFYVIGRSVDLYPQIVRRTVAEGHEIGNHSQTHRLLSKLGDEELRQEMSRCRDAVGRAAGVQPRTMRPPYGGLLQRQRELVHAEFGYPDDPLVGRSARLETARSQRRHLTHSRRCFFRRHRSRPRPAQPDGRCHAGHSRRAAPPGIQVRHGFPTAGHEDRCGDRSSVRDSIHLLSLFHRSRELFHVRRALLRDA